MAGATGFGQILRQVAKPSLMSGALSGGAALMLGANPLQALASGAIDTLASAIPLAGLRKFSPQSYGTTTYIHPKTGKQITHEITHPLETPLNIATSLGTGSLVSPLIYGGGQEQQIAQQLQQRSVVNQLPMEQELASLAPGTMSQVSSAEFQQLLNQSKQNNWTQYLSPEDQELIAGTLNPRMM